MAKSSLRSSARPPIRRNNFSMIQGWSNPGAAEATIEFGRFRLLLRRMTPAD